MSSRAEAVDSTRHVSSWKPLLSGSDAERALVLARALADPLRWAPADGAGTSLAAGASGVALMFAFLANALGDEAYAASAERYRSLMLDGDIGPTTPAGLGLFGGATGVAWAETIIASLQGEDTAGCADLDEVLIAGLQAPWRGRFGLAGGLVGIGVYALARSRARPEVLALVLERLEDARPDLPQGVIDAAALFGHARAAAPAPALDLGIAHGLAGVVSLAALAHGFDAGHRLLSEATGALLAHELPASSATAFPSLTVGGGRACWCDGDVGIAAALSLAGPLVSHPLVPPATARAIASASGPSGVEPLGLYNGLAGVAHVHHVVALSTRCERTWEAGANWARSLLDRLEAGERCDRTGLLHGTAGVVLTLLASATDVAPAWNRALLVA